MEGVESWSINDSTLMADEHLTNIVEGVDNDSSRVAEFDLED